MRVNAVIVLCSDESFDIQVHKPTLPKYEVVVDNYISSDEIDVKVEIING